jgi:hypothetical protein
MTDADDLKAARDRVVITPMEFAALRARLEQRLERLIKALHVVADGRPENERPGGVADHLFKFLGIVTFWLSLDEPPSRKWATDVQRALDMFTIEVRG